MATNSAMAPKGAFFLSKNKNQLRFKNNLIYLYKL